MATKKNSRSARSASVSSNGGSPVPSAKELVVVAKSGAGMRVSPSSVRSEAGAEVGSVEKILKSGVTLTPLFGDSEDRLRAEAAAAAETGVAIPDLSVFYHVDAPESRLAELAKQFEDNELFEAAYVKPAAEPARLNEMTPNLIDAPPATPNFQARQLYLGAAPGGIEALWMHGQPGGKGTNIRIIDVEGAWRFTHEDLLANADGLLHGFHSSDIRWRNHGTAVIGVTGGDENAIGVLGISPHSRTRGSSIFLNAAGTSASSSQAIKKAADALSAGDIILLELHRPGPRHNFQPRDDQRGYIAIEWWEDDFQAILYATNKGIIVVEAAGNGAENLDDPIYSVRPAGFPPAWTNPFNRSNRDCKAIVVGAGAPPPGTHGRNHGPDRSRLDFSNYGALVDAQGWGREVTTCGYGDLQGPAGQENLWYTDTFSGTSSASPIVVGAIACYQGYRKAKGQPILSPLQMRNKLRTTGSPQTDAPGRPATQRIGNRPNLKQMVGPIVKFKDAKVEKVEVKELKVEKAEAKELKTEIKEKVEIKEKNEKSEIDVIKRFEIGPGVGYGEEAMGAPALAVAQCTSFAAMPIGIGPNPRMGTQARFFVFNPAAALAPNTVIQQIPFGGGVFRGLNCGIVTECRPFAPARQVILSLVHFGVPATVRAFNADGTLAGAAIMGPAPGAVQTFTFNGPSIVRVRIMAPQNRVLLLRFCWRRAGVAPEAPGASLEERVAALEAALGQTGHFIPPEMRPDLSEGALTGEEDYGATGMGADFEKESADAMSPDMVDTGE
jgi:subtilisin family serine protease